VRVRLMHLVRRMIQEHLEQLRVKLEQAAGLPESARTELMELVRAVENDAGIGETAASNTAAPEGGGEAVAASGIDKLLSAVDELEASHPDLAASINQVASTLARMGI